VESSFPIVYKSRGYKGYQYNYKASEILVELANKEKKAMDILLNAKI